MAKKINIEDIDAQIAALKEQRKKMLQEQQEQLKKEVAERQASIGKEVEKILGPVTDLKLFSSILENNKALFKVSEEPKEASEISFS